MSGDSRSPELKKIGGFCPYRPEGTDLDFPWSLCPYRPKGRGLGLTPLSIESLLSATCHSEGPHWEPAVYWTVTHPSNEINLSELG